MEAPLDKRPLVLIVDDDERTAELLGRLLQEDGYDTEVLLDGAAALERLARDPAPDVLLTDFHLPHADGLVVARRARSRRSMMPIFVVTGYPQSLARAGPPLDDPVVVITKPLDYAHLLRRLTAALAR